VRVPLLIAHRLGAGYRYAACSRSSVSAPGQSSSKGSAVSGLSTVPSTACMSREPGST
jgi:hypothetical protein